MIGDLATRCFSLDENFLDQYREHSPHWGPLGLVTFRRTYARTKEDGTRESFFDCCQRVVEGTVSIQKNHCAYHCLPWDDAKAQRTAQRMFRAMWEFKFLPPGRGLWSMGTEHMKRNGSASTNNCAGVSTQTIHNGRPSKPFAFLMDMMMLGVGVGFDTRGAGKITWRDPNKRVGIIHQVEDSREGWVESTALILDAYLNGPSRILPAFDYSRLRGPGIPLKVFGGVSSGPKPLMDLHTALMRLGDKRAADGSTLGSVDILDVMNLIGKCVNSGNIRRGAEVALGSHLDEAFLHAKTGNWFQDHPHRSMSNNSIFAEVGMDYAPFVEAISQSGDPGFFWLNNARQYGRMIDGANGRDHLVSVQNPCGEQSLESWELCTLTETFPSRHATLKEYLDTLKLAYLYAKTVTLVPTHVPETNAVMLRNRRIGCSQSGITAAFARHGRRETFRWCEEAYRFVVGLDKQYSAWLCIPESIKKTTVKPSGTTSLLPGEPPGIHYPHSEYYIRRMRMASTDMLVPALIEAGYRTELDAVLPDTTIIEFPVREAFFVRSKRDVTMWEQLENAAAYQAVWSDNQVSSTISFQPHEAKDIPRALELYETRLKAISFLPLEAHNYVQPPYETIDREEWERRIAPLKPLAALDTEVEGGAVFCDSEACAL